MQKTLKKCILDFGEFQLPVELFDCPLANRFYEGLPYTVSLTSWGNEAYGSIGIDLGEDNPVPEIPKGGLAYTNTGNYVCIFYGQSPAWPVEYIGQIHGGQWQKLLSRSGLSQVIIKEV